MNKQLVDRKDYWASFYTSKSEGGKLLPPSQFAAFIAQELEPNSAVFDVGCGNGRDSLFFAELGFKVVALDASENGIRLIEQQAKERNLDNIKAIAGDVNGPLFLESIAQLEGVKACVYARFFLHAINEYEQAMFLETLSQSLHSRNRVAFEYRTTEDQFLKKETPPHYRRYQSAIVLNKRLQDLGFREIYTTEGQGYAKYKADDAFVARCIFEKL